MHATLPLLRASDFPALRRAPLTTLQVNLGYRCNQSCVHCHVNAGPKRTEMMDFATMQLIPDVMAARKIETLDLTGGAPELHPHFRWLVHAARRLRARVIDRCNLTILSEPGQEDLADFLAAQRVEAVASLPCYEADNVDRQRGKGVFERSIEGLRQLNRLGYGQPDSGLMLNLVFNPQGAELPPEQSALQAAYQHELFSHYGVVFNRLLTITNMPIQRFGSTLVSHGQFELYKALLKASHREANLSQVMCRSMLSVDWQGRLYDCDFNQMLGLPARIGGKPRAHLRDLLDVDPDGASIEVADHCYGCTAGHGSSCGGALKTDAGQR